MRWQETLATAKARAHFRNRARPALLVALFSIASGGAGFGLMSIVALRIIHGVWLPGLALVAGMVGALIFLVLSLSRRFPAIQQEIELRPHQFWIRGTREFVLDYRKLRGYSVVASRVGTAVHRLLLLYPRQGGGLFSIGMPPEVAEDEVHGILSGRAPYTTIIDDEALRVI